jgi:hypothetical protein
MNDNSPRLSIAEDLHILGGIAHYLDVLLSRLPQLETHQLNQLANACIKVQVRANHLTTEARKRSHLKRRAEGYSL